jgi:hypothetical protein
MTPHCLRGRCTLAAIPLPSGQVRHVRLSVRGAEKDGAKPHQSFQSFRAQRLHRVDSSGSPGREVSSY